MDWFRFLIIPATFSFFGTFLYKKIAIRKNYVANPNFRNLHTKPVPVGGGIIFSFAFVLSLFSIWCLNQFSNHLFLVLVIGGGVATLFGFLDDLQDIRAKNKLVVQILLSGWVVFWFDGGSLIYFQWLPSFVSILATLLFLVWLMNAYNFMDGIDGMAISGAVFVFATMIGVLLWTRPESEFIPIMLLLLASTLRLCFLIGHQPQSLWGCR